MRISLMVAVAENGVIGRDGDLPWRLPADLKRLKRLTIGHVIVMGRKTFESIGRPLPKRRSVVITRDPAWRHDGVAAVHSLDEALRQAPDEDEVFILGGAEIFALAWPRADRLYLTRVHAEFDGDVFLPELDWSGWRRIDAEHHPADPRHAYAFTFEQWQAVPPARAGESL